MNLNQLYYFVAVCDRKSFSKAAAEIFVTQPTLSKQIAALETELGIKLIERRKNSKFQLTSSGEVYLESFRRIIQEFEGTMEMARALEQKKRSLSIGVLESWMCPDLICRCNTLVETEFPNVKLDFELLPPKKLNSRLQSGGLDIVLYTEGVYEPVEGYSREKLCSIESLVLMAADRADRLENLQDEEFYSYPLGDLNNINSQTMYRFLGRRNLLVEERETLRSINAAVLAGKGFALIDAWAETVHDPRFCKRKLPGVFRDVVLTWRALDDSACTKAILNCIRSWVAEKGTAQTEEENEETPVPAKAFMRKI